MRHTYISLVANMIAEKYPKKQLLSALQLLADSVGNTVEVLSKHYLDITEDVILPSFGVAFLPVPFLTTGVAFMELGVAVSDSYPYFTVV